MTKLPKQPTDFDKLVSTKGSGGELHQQAGDSNEKLTTAQGVTCKR